METAVGRCPKAAQLLVSFMTLASSEIFSNHVDSAVIRPVGVNSRLICHRLRYLSLATPPTGCLRFHFLKLLSDKKRACRRDADAAKGL